MAVMHLNKGPFEKIRAGKKIVEMRLYDEKRRKLKVGDKITFVLAGNDEERFDAEITNLLVYDNFAELYEDYTATELGYEEGETPNPADMEEYYSKTEQEKYGVVGIELELL